MMAAGMLDLKEIIMPKTTIDGKQPTSIPPKVEAKIKAGVPPRTAMSTSGKPVRNLAVKV